MSAVRKKATRDLWPVYEFRPAPDWLRAWGWAPGRGPRDVPLYRYNGGNWIPDDGEYDLAFANLDGPPLCLYIEMPYHRNVLWSWLTRSWRDSGPSAHPTYRGSSSPNPWHYSLRPGAKKWGGVWGRDRHENRLAGEAGMSWVSKQRGCANGRHAEWKLDDPHMRAGLVRERVSKAVVIVPDAPECMYCGLDWVQRPTEDAS